MLGLSCTLPVMLVYMYRLAALTFAPPGMYMDTFAYCIFPTRQSCIVVVEPCGLEPCGAVER